MDRVRTLSADIATGAKNRRIDLGNDPAATPDTDRTRNLGNDQTGHHQQTSTDTHPTHEPAPKPFFRELSNFPGSGGELPVLGHSRRVPTN
ncbi:MAG TPA: hypothetical protein ENH93_11800 [Pseudohongiella sp.]|nr:hypothetical protein [Pseudohongiella sp.]HEA63801.1 hypothetical protein [Pseudohongiella sp.]